MFFFLSFVLFIYISFISFICHSVNFFLAFYAINVYTRTLGHVHGVAFCGWFLFCIAALCVRFSFAISLLMKRELFALLYVNCILSVMLVLCASSSQVHGLCLGTLYTQSICLIGGKLIIIIFWGLYTLYLSPYNSNY